MRCRSFLALLAAASVVLQTGCSDPAAEQDLAPPPEEAIAPAPQAIAPQAIAPQATRSASAAEAPVFPPEDPKPAFRSASAAEAPALPSPEQTQGIVLSDQASTVSQIAERNGDRTYVMIDKARGKIILFENGAAVLSAAALTGASESDRLTKKALNEAFSTRIATANKVTPAGRFTVTRGYDKEYGGTVFDINELQGSHWIIAIHQVYLGIPSERRDARLSSDDPADNHITFGCINIAPETMRKLMETFPAKQKAVLYILPEDAAKTASYFQIKGS